MEQMELTAQNINRFWVGRINNVLSNVKNFKYSFCHFKFIFIVRKLPDVEEANQLQKCQKKHAPTITRFKTHVSAPIVHFSILLVTENSWCREVVSANRLRSDRLMKQFFFWLVKLSVICKMYKSCIFVITSILFAVASCQDIWGLVHFSRSNEDLLLCLVNHDIFRNLQATEEKAALRAVAKLLAQKFHSVTVTTCDLRYVQRSVNLARNRHRVTLRNDQVWEQLKEDFKTALLDCSDSSDGKKL